MNSLITVLLPAYNVEKYIEKTIKSILNQTYQNFELVVIDDGSTDKTYKIVENIALKDNRIKLYSKQNEKNISKTRNFALNLINGEYTVFVDADDILHKKFLEKLYEAITSTNSDMAMCGYNIVGKHAPIVQSNKAPKVVMGTDIFSYILLNLNFMVWNKIYKSSLIKKIQFDETALIGEDFIFSFNYAKLCKKVAIVKNKLYTYIKRKGSLSHQKFSSKQYSFILALQNLIKKEENEEIKNLLKGWLSFSCGMYTFIAKRKEYPIEYYNMLQNFHEYKQYFLKNKNAKKSFKFLMRLSLISWNRKGLKLKAAKSV